jgi:hypothetical protein
MQTPEGEAINISYVLTSFFTGSSFSDKISSMWHGLDMYAAQEPLWYNRNIQDLAQEDKYNSSDKLTVDASMSTVGPASLFLSLVHLNVRNVEGINIQTLDLCCRNNQH